MLVAFDELPDSARIWIYQSSRKFTIQEAAQIEEKTTRFLEQWVAHGAPLKSGFQILHEQFLVISVDEGLNAASGCSIDSSVALIKDLEQSFAIDFFDRTQVCFLRENQVFSTPITHIKSLIQEGKIDSKTMTFNNLVQNIEQFKTKWVIPAEDSWIKRYF